MSAAAFVVLLAAVDVAGLLGGNDIRLPGIGFHQMHHAARESLIEPHAGHEHRVDVGYRTSVAIRISPFRWALIWFVYGFSVAETEAKR